MNLDLSNHRALVCGSTSGIGRACAIELAQLGAHVTLLARDAEKLQRVSLELPRPKGQTHNFIVADLSDPAAVRAAVEANLPPNAQPLNPPPTILINNTGGPPAGPAVDAKPEDLMACFRAQLITAHVLTQLLIPIFKAAGFGRVVNITSTSVKSPIPNLAVSNIVRPAVAAWAKCMSLELAPFGVTVNNVLPGYTNTDRLASLLKNRAAKQNVPFEKVQQEVIAATPAGRLGEPEEIAAAVAFLCTPAAAYVNGINVPVDGGRLMVL